MAAEFSGPDAIARVVPGLIEDAETGDGIVVSGHGRPVAAVVSTSQPAALNVLQADLRDAALVLARAATDTGVRAPLDEVLTAFGVDRAELEAELDAEIVAGRT